MAKFIDTRNSGGQLVILGNAVVMPTSHAPANAATAPNVAGSMRYNSVSDRIEYLSNASTNWNAVGISGAEASTFLLKAGGTMTGGLSIQTNPNGTSVAATIGGANGVLTIASTGSIIIPIGNTAQRPSNAQGSIRYNTTLADYEFGAPAWQTLTSRMNSVVDAKMAAGSIQFLDGNVSNPGITFSANTSTGLARVSGALVMSVGGTAAVVANVATTTVNNVLQVADDVVPTSNTTVNLGSNTNHYKMLYVETIFANAITAGSLAYTGNTTADIIPSTDNTYSLGSSSFKFLAAYATTFYGTATSAQYADLSERYHADAAYAPGTVVVLGGVNEITISTQASDKHVAGVISTAPGFRLNDDAGTDATHPHVALRGRVPVKVIGPVARGDLLVTSSTPGHAQTSEEDFPHYSVIIGKAITSFEDTGPGMVEVLV